MKVKLLETISSDAGHYSGFANMDWSKENVVEATYVNDKKDSIYVLGSEFIRVGGLPEAFNPDLRYMYGTFEEV